MVGLTNGESGHFANVTAAETNGSRFGAQAGSLTVRASSVAAILAQHDAHVQLVFLLFELGEESVDAGERSLAVEHQGLLGASQFSPRSVERNAVLQGEFLEFRLKSAIFGPRPGIDRAIVEGLLFVRNNQVDIEIDGVAKAPASFARAVWIVKREEPGFGIAIGTAAKLALKGLGKTQALRFPALFTGHGFEYDFSRLTKADLGGADDPCSIVCRHDEAID